MEANEYGAALRRSLLEANIVPGAAESLIEEDFVPSTKLGISFGTKEVDLGNFFRAGECKQPPSILFAPEKDGSAASYAFFLTDPDAPTPDDPKFAFWRHWVLAGLQPSANKAIEVTADHALTEYLGPAPKDEYVFELFLIRHALQVDLSVQLKASSLPVLAISGTKRMAADED